jgi:hypothetical protein
METFAYDGLNKLQESLNATNVLSQDYARTVMGWALSVASEAHEAGRGAEAERWLAAGQRWRRKGDSPIEALITNVVRVRRGGPSWENGRRDHVILFAPDLPSAAQEGDWTVNTDEFVREWTRQA